MTGLDPTMRLMAALRDIWSAIRAGHPGVPDVVLLPAPNPLRQSNVLGYFAGLRWQQGSSVGRLSEVVVVAEHMNRGAEDVFSTLLHEAAHAQNFHAGIRDVSRNQYHNKEFRRAAQQLGLEVSRVAHYGFAETTVPDATALRYAAQIASLTEALMFRMSERNIASQGSAPSAADPPTSSKPSARSRKATCDCGFIIRVARKTMTETVIRCDRCAQPFTFS